LAGNEWATPDGPEASVQVGVGKSVQIAPPVVDAVRDDPIVTEPDGAAGEDDRGFPCGRESDRLD
jgi:hypothetical protein